MFRKPSSSLGLSRVSKLRTFSRNSRKKLELKTWKNICASAWKTTKIRSQLWEIKSKRILKMQSSCETKNETSAISTSQSTHPSVVIFATRPYLIGSSMCSRVCMHSTESVSQRSSEMKNISLKMPRSESWSTNSGDTTVKSTLSSRWRICRWKHKTKATKARISHYSQVSHLASPTSSHSLLV